jgi:hypothetical protein
MDADAGVSAPSLVARYRDSVTVTPGRGYEMRLRKDLSTVLGWLRDYVGKPSPHIGRSGPVCPFVPAALNAMTLRFRFRYEIDCHDATGIRTLITNELRAFRQATKPPRASAASSLDAWLVVLPDADETGWAGIDEVYLSLKSIAVGHGLMIGQFHPACAERAVRNPVFPVSRSPLALFAVRHIAPHDVMFLHQEKHWFEAYQQRFGEHFDRGTVRDKLLRELYESASQRFGPGPPAERPTEQDRADG